MVSGCHCLDAVGIEICFHGGDSLSYAPPPVPRDQSHSVLRQETNHTETRCLTLGLATAIIYLFYSFTRSALRLALNLF